MPISGVSLWELTWSKTLRNVPITNIGTFRFIVKQVVFFWLFFHLFYLVCGQIHQAIHLFLETFRALQRANFIALFNKVIHRHSLISTTVFVFSLYQFYLCSPHEPELEYIIMTSTLNHFVSSIVTNVVALVSLK